MIGLDWLQAESLLILLISSAATSFIAAAAGIGGGVVMLAIMALIFPAHAVIPVHGVVQIGSNAGRAMIMARDIVWSVLPSFAIGSLIGGAIGGAVVVQLPPYILQLSLAGFILFSAWGKFPRIKSRSAVTITGIFSTFITMFIGATGAFVAAMVKSMGLGRMQHVATHSSCMVAQHGVKVATFGLLGFTYAAYLPLISLMILSGMLGTLVGRRVLTKMVDRKFQQLLTLTLTLLALRLCWIGVQGAISDHDLGQWLQRIEDGFTWPVMLLQQWLME